MATYYFKPKKQAWNYKMVKNKNIYNLKVQNYTVAIKMRKAAVTDLFSRNITREDGVNKKKY